MTDMFFAYLVLGVAVILFSFLLFLPQGSGPMGLPTPWDVSAVIQQLRGEALKVWPKLEGLMRQPGASELVQSLATQLSQRFAARAIKLVFAAQQEVVAVASSSGAAGLGQLGGGGGGDKARAAGAATSSFQSPSMMVVPPQGATTAADALLQQNPTLQRRF